MEKGEVVHLVPPPPLGRAGGGAWDVGGGRESVAWNGLRTLVAW